MAKALATEAGINFLLVKGPEVILFYYIIAFLLIYILAI
jgi:hypothetical protein